MKRLAEDKVRAVTIADVARRLQVSPRAVRVLVRRGELKTVRIGRACRVSLHALDEYLHANSFSARDDQALSPDEIADVQASLEAMRRGEYVSLEELVVSSCRRGI